MEAMNQPSAEVLRRIYPRVLARALAFTRSLPDAEDAVQEAIVGLSTGELALAFVVEPRAIEQRLTRARKRLRTHGDAEGTTPEAARERLDAVLRVIYLLFNEGYWSGAAATPIRGDLCRLAIGLAHSLAGLFGDDPEVLGLAALLVLHDARRGAREVDGVAIPLPDQDRSRWNADAIALATAMLDRALALGRPGPYQIEAAISAIHCEAPSAAATDWTAIAALYDRLEQLRPTPAVRVNRAFAIARAEGPAAGLALLEGVDYPYVHLVRGSLSAEQGLVEQARASFSAARAVARNSAEREQIDAKIVALDLTHDSED
jgi:RNA polymerase sigma-70 factor, ECF subfamily